MPKSIGIEDAAAWKPRSIVLTSTHASKGGVSAFAGMIAEDMAQRGWATCRLAIYRSHYPDPNAFDHILSDAASLRLTGYVFSVLSFLRYICVRRPDVILGMMPLSNILAGIAGRVVGAHVIATHHSPYNSHSRILRYVDRIAGRMGAYDSILCVSDAVSASFESHPQRYRDLIKVIPNGVRPNIVASTPAGIKERFGIDPEMPFVLVVGRLAKQKNPVAAVEAVARVPDVQLVFAGEGELRQEVLEAVDRHGLARRVRLLGNIEHDQVQALLRVCDAFMQVSLWEGQSFALLEAIAAAAPMILSDIPTQLEPATLPTGVVGATVCNAADFEDIAQGVRRTVFDEDWRAVLRKRAAILQARLRTGDQMLDDYASHLESLFRRAHPGV